MHISEGASWKGNLYEKESLMKGLYEAWEGLREQMLRCWTQVIPESYHYFRGKGAPGVQNDPRS